MGHTQQIKSNDVNLKELLLENKYLFRVTNYQRHYVWTEQQVRQFLTDGEFCWKQKLEGKIFVHFAGQIILRLDREDRNMRKEMEIVDGQQRLTTYMILIGRIAQKIWLDCGKGDLAEQYWKKYFISTAECGEDKKRLILSKKDQAFWEKLIYWKERKELILETESHKHLNQAAKVIDEFLERITKENKSLNPAGLMQNYAEAVAESFRVVLLTTEQEGYAYALYQTVNDRGVPLTSGELLKARTIELLSDKKKMAEEAEELWNAILEDSGSVTDRFLTWHYVAVTGTRLETKKGTTIHEQYEKNIFQCDGLRFISDVHQEKIRSQLISLKTNVEYMRNMAQGILSENISNYSSILFEALIKLLKNTFCIPVYLKILEMNGKNKIKTLNRITPMLAKAFFMARTVGGLHDSMISNTYLEIWKYIESERADLDAIRECLEQLLQKEHCRQGFISKIRDTVYLPKSGNGKAKFLLLMEELYCQLEAEGGEHECGDDSVKILLSNMSIEHILSQDTPSSEVSREFYEGIHKLGNLTLTGERINSRMRNAPFEEKRERYLRSPYYITREVGKLEHWRRENFEERQEKMIADLTEAFKL